METARCKAFLAAAETGSFARAAERLSYTPSGVNQLVTALEQAVGCCLLHRSRRGGTLTENGRILLPAIRDLIHQEDRIFALAAQVQGLFIGSVTIAAYSSIATHWLPAVIRAFQQDHPQIRIQLREGIRQEVTGWLDERIADLAFLSRQEPMPYDWIGLAEDPMVAILPRDHPLAGADAYPVERCAYDPIIMPALGRDDDVAALFARHGVTPNVRFTTLENFAAIAMVEQGLGVSIMNDLITQKRISDVVKLPLAPAASIELGLALPAHETPSPAVLRFRDYAVRALTRGGT